MKKSDVLEYFGTTQRAAIAIGISHVAVGKWGDVVPYPRALSIEDITDGKLKPEPEMYKIGYISKNSGVSNDFNCPECGGTTSKVTTGTHSSTTVFTCSNCKDVRFGSGEKSVLKYGDI